MGDEKRGGNGFPISKVLRVPTAIYIAMEGGRPELYRAEALHVDESTAEAFACAAPEGTEMVTDYMPGELCATALIRRDRVNSNVPQQMAGRRAQA